MQLWGLLRGEQPSLKWGTLAVLNEARNKISVAVEEGEGGARQGRRPEIYETAVEKFCSKTISLSSEMIFFRLKLRLYFREVGRKI